MSMPPIGVMAGVMPIMGVWPIIGVAPPAIPTFKGVSSQRDRPRLPAGVAPTAGVSPAAHPGVAPPSTCTAAHPTQQQCNRQTLIYGLNITLSPEDREAARSRKSRAAKLSVEGAHQAW